MDIGVEGVGGLGCCDEASDKQCRVLRDDSGSNSEEGGHESEKKWHQRQKGKNSLTTENGKTFSKRF